MNATGFRFNGKFKKFKMNENRELESLIQSA